MHVCGVFFKRGSSICPSYMHTSVAGNGDILSFEDYNRHRRETGVAGIMIARWNSSGGFGSGQETLGQHNPLLDALFIPALLSVSTSHLFFFTLKSLFFCVHKKLGSGDWEQGYYTAKIKWFV